MHSFTDISKFPDPIKLSEEKNEEESRKEEESVKKRARVRRRIKWRARQIIVGRRISGKSRKLKRGFTNTIKSKLSINPKEFIMHIRKKNFILQILNKLLRTTNP